ncbi:MAG: 16S rRNA (guanine(527)-N(7))-methyltransferase RsmG [Nitrospinota bacterium]|nr:16S rRNA (guanine(527)-N(7))-methyltransferase RsmG [Nitrospinota bacterium]
MNIFEILEDARLGLSPESTLEQIKLQLSSYLHLLVKWNKKINLTSEKTAQEILQRHVFDSLHYCRTVFPNDRIIDIGSGAGFPGIPLKIIYPNLNAILVESQRKRCSFLNTVIQELNLGKTIVVNARAEQILPAPLVDVVVLRAVSDINSCLELAAGFLGRGGKVVLKKDPDEKTHQTPKGFSLAQERVVLGYNDKQSNLLVFKKCFT